MNDLVAIDFLGFVPHKRRPLRLSSTTSGRNPGQQLMKRKRSRRHTLANRGKSQVSPPRFRVLFAIIAEEIILQLPVTLYHQVRGDTDKVWPARRTTIIVHRRGHQMAELRRSWFRDIVGTSGCRHSTFPGKWTDFYTILYDFLVHLKRNQ